MNRHDFLNCPEVNGFITWAANFLRDDLQVLLEITTKGTKGAGVVEGTYKGINQIAKAYKWKSKWQTIDGSEAESIDWNTTSAYLSFLGDSLRKSVNERNLDRTYEVCRLIIKWGGGDRNPNVGAIKFLTEKKFDGSLCEYIEQCQIQLCLDNADDTNLDKIGDMNAMLTKVHAIAAIDGLPIYDSRVAGAIACLIEIYFRNVEPDRKELPKELTFNPTDPAARRQVSGLCSTIRVPKEMTRLRTKNRIIERSREWAFSKIRLAWLMRAIMDKADHNKKPLFSQEITANQSEMHAFEAALFMIGFDVSCLRPNLIVP